MHAMNNLVHVYNKSLHVVDELELVGKKSVAAMDGGYSVLSPLHITVIM